jgi:hypothetical protein
MTLDALSIDRILDRVAATLDLPFELQAEAERQYRLVGEYLSDQAALVDWDIYPQGSVRLGTVVRPLTGGSGFDLDMVCRVGIAKTSTSQAELKERVGKALAAYVEVNSARPGAPAKCEPSRRCWTLYYQDEFHMDVLPAIPDVEALPTGILLTDKQLSEWQRSDPIAYAEWFKRQMEQQFNRRRKMLAAEARKSIDAIPDWQVRTTLQRVVQLLKRHRDVHFLEDPDDRPPSILITTLVARAYDGEEDLLEATLAATSQMPDYIEVDAQGHGIVMSPVADENFADKWTDYPEREGKFRYWMHKVTADLEGAANQRGIPNAAEQLGPAFGREVVVKAVKALGAEVRGLSEAGKLGVGGAVAGLTSAAAATRGPSHHFYGRGHLD